MSDLNYRHLRYFHEVARDGRLTRAAHRLNLSQSALSAQIRALEDRLGHALFDRVGRTLELTEVGRIALDHAERIFTVGDELLATLDRSGGAEPPLRVGAPSTLSRNFQMRFLRPALGADGPGLALRSGDAATLLEALSALSLDVVLTTERPPSPFISQKIAEQPVGLHGAPHRLAAGDLATLLSAQPIIAPTESGIRAGFDSVCARLGVAPRIAAEVDDMAMVRLLAREDVGVALTPTVVLADEIASGRLASAEFDLGVSELFFAVTVPRAFPHPRLAALLDGAASTVAL